MASKAEKELRNIAKQILNSEKKLDLEKISTQILTLYEKIILLKYLKKYKNHSWDEQQSHFDRALEILEMDKRLNIRGDTDVEEEVPPLMDTIKNIVTEIPEEEKSEEIFSKKNLSNRAFNEEESKAKKKIKKNLNDQFAKKLQIDRNDKNAFIKHLFNEKRDNYEGVISQIEKFNSFEEARQFVNETVKINHNNWGGKEFYEKRFISLIEKNFL